MLLKLVTLQNPGRVLISADGIDTFVCDFHGELIRLSPPKEGSFIEDPNLQLFIQAYVKTLKDKLGKKQCTITSNDIALITSKLPVVTYMLDK